MNIIVNRIKNTFFWSKGIDLGKNSQFKRGVVFQKENLKIGDFVHVGPDCYIHAGGGIRVGDGTIIGPKVKIWSVNHEYANFKVLPYTPKVIKGSVIIGRGCWIGLDVKICPNVKIGDGVIVAMGSVITKDIPDFVIVGGNPAKIIRKRYQSNDEKELLSNIIQNGNYYGKKHF